ncbi:MAG: PD40 domain-containing protein [Deltaproteobacteria bacterium]|nr:PD40 domain-containing protein [Deltaproteobacteria bacterium]
MKSLKNKKILNIFLFSVIFVFAINKGYTAETQATASKPVKIKGEQEILVARDVSGGKMLYTPRWCGSNALLFKTSGGIELIDIISRKKVKISSDQDDEPLNCTPDGKWVFYHRWSRDLFFPNMGFDESTYDESTGMDADLAPPLLKINEVYRYEVATGIRQKFAITKDFGPTHNMVSPDGKKFLLGPECHLVTANAPMSNYVWFNGDIRRMDEPVWFKDSSGVTAFVPGRLGIEFFGENGWVKTFDLWKPGTGISNSSLKVDLENRIYFVTTETALEMSEGILPQLRGNYLLHRCVIKSTDLVCEKIMVRKNLGPFDVLPDGDIIFELIYDKGLHRFSPGKTGDELEIDAQYGGDTYDSVHVIGVSPDGKRFAFERFKETAVFEGTVKADNYFRYDLFVIEITDDQGGRP